MVAASYAECDEMQVIIYFIFAFCVSGFNLAGTNVNLMDLGPNFVSPLSGLVNSFQMFSAIISQYVTRVLTSNVSVYCPLSQRNDGSILIFSFLGIYVRMAFRSMVDIWLLHNKNDHLYTFRIGEDSAMERFQGDQRQ